MYWNFRFITDWDTIFSESFQKQWLQWVEFAENSHVFFHPTLCRAWIETYLPIRKLEPLFCVAEKEGNTIILPMVLWKQNWKNAWRRLIVPVGYSDFDYHDPLMVGAKITADSMDQFYEELLKKLSGMVTFDEFILDGLTLTSTLKWSVAEHDIAHFLPITDLSDGEQLLKGLTSHLRRDIRRLVRRLEEKGQLSLVQYNRDEGLAHLGNFLKAHSQRWPAAFKAPLFHNNLLMQGIENGTVHFSGLNLDDVVLSWHLGFNFNNRYYYYMSVIDSSWSEFSPGKIHVFKLIELAIVQKLEIFDFLRGDEIYKTGWTNHKQNIYQLRVTSDNYSSQLKRLSIVFKNFLR